MGWEITKVTSMKNNWVVDDEPIFYKKNGRKSPFLSSIENLLLGVPDMVDDHQTLNFDP